MGFGSLLSLIFNRVGKQQICAVYQHEQDADLKHCVMENSAVVWNAPLLSTCFWGNRRMISSGYNSDKCSEHDGQAVIYILFKEVQRGVIVISHVESMCTLGQTWSLHTRTTYLDLKWFGSGFMVSCYSIILFSAASVGAALGGVSWYRMCHCSPNPIFSSVFLLSMHDSTPRRNYCLPSFSLTKPCTELPNKPHNSRFLYLIMIPLRLRVN